MTFDITKLPARMHGRVLDLYHGNDYMEIKRIFLYHKVIHCDSCANMTTLRDWLNYWEKMGILAVNSGQEPSSSTD